MVKKKPIERKKQSETEALSLIELYRDKIEKNLNEIREYRELIREINKKYENYEKFEHKPDIDD